MEIADVASIFLVNNLDSHSNQEPHGGMAEKAWFDPIYEREWRRLHWHACQFVGEDKAQEIVQEAFARLLSQYRGGRIRLGDEGKWLNRIVRNLSIDVLRKEKKTEQIKEGFDTADTRLNPEELFFSKLTRKEILAGVAQLPAREQQIIILRNVEELSMQETAEALSLTTRQVERSMGKAYYHLRKILNNMQ